MRYTLFTLGLLYWFNFADDLKNGFDIGACIWLFLSLLFFSKLLFKIQAQAQHEAEK